MTEPTKSRKPKGTGEARTRKGQAKHGTKTVEGVVIGKGDNERVIPEDEVYKLAKLWCSYKEIAEWFDVPVETLKYNFRDTIERGKSETKQALRRAQIKVALTGNVTMLIWLGKNILGQSDSPVEVNANEVLPWLDDN